MLAGSAPAFSCYVEVVVYARETERQNRDGTDRERGESYFYHGRAYDIVDIHRHTARLKAFMETREGLLIGWD